MKQCGITPSVVSAALMKLVISSRSSSPLTSAHTVKLCVATVTYCMLTRNWYTAVYLSDADVSKMLLRANSLVQCFIFMYGRCRKMSMFLNS